MTPDEQSDANEVCEISNKVYEDGIELLYLIEAIQQQNDEKVRGAIGAGEGAYKVVGNGLLSRIVLIVAGAYARARPGDLHLRRAFELLEQPEVRNEAGLRGSSEVLDEAIALWQRYRCDHRLDRIMHFWDKFTAHFGKPEKERPPYGDLFSFAVDTTKIMDALARGTGARFEPLSEWHEDAANSAERFWSPWKRS